jgi:YegS/Rv2252/BmrU family lipid kinase
MSKKIGIVFNPVAGKGKAQRIERKLLDVIRKKHPAFHFEHTQHSGHAYQLAKSMVNNVDVIIAAGGDGTLNNVAAAVAGTKTPIGILPIGSGNDFIRSIGIPNDPYRALDIAFNGNKKLFDLGSVTVTEKNARFVIQKKFLNSFGMGLDAEIAYETQAINHLRGIVLYGYAAIKALIRYKPIEIQIQSDSWTKKLNALFVCVGNGQYEGGGFKLTPQARPDDAMFQMCIVPKMPVGRILNAVMKVSKGLHGSVDGIELLNVKQLHIRSETPTVIHVDGEIVSRKAIKAELSIEPKSVWIQVPG